MRSTRREISTTRPIGNGTAETNGHPLVAVVFHADDFGMNRAVTAGILRAFTHGVLTSTALLANAPDAEAALAAWSALKERAGAGSLPSSSTRRALREPDAPFELGIHLNLTQGKPLTGHRYPPQLLDEDGCFCGIGGLFRRLHRRRPKFESALRSELSAQIEFVLDHGQLPTHLNGHQYIETLPGLRGVLHDLLVRYRIGCLRVARERGLFRTTVANRFEAANWCLAHVKRFYASRLLKTANSWDVQFSDAYFGTSHAGRIDLRLVRQFLKFAKGHRLIEIGVHPAAVATIDTRETAAGWHDPLAAGRPKELDLLTSHTLVELLQASGISLGRLMQRPAIDAAKVA